MRPRVDLVYDQCYCPRGSLTDLGGSCWQAIKVASFQTTEAAHLSLFEKRDELHRILESRYFSNSPKKTRFLEFVAEQTFLGSGEYLIGVEVYERGVEFNPQRDPIVRVQAYEIRRLLKTYYEDEGKNNSVRMDLPSGHYVPAFTRALEEYEAPERIASVLGMEQETDRLPMDTRGQLCDSQLGACSFADLWGSEPPCEPGQQSSCHVA